MYQQPSIVFQEKALYKIFSEKETDEDGLAQTQTVLARTRIAGVNDVKTLC